MKSVLCGFASLAVMAALTISASAADESTKKVLAGEVKSLEGEKVDLSKYDGKVLLVVNVASKCGATPQYKQLQALHEEYKDQGFAVLGFPCNQFGSQEPGTAAEIRSFCTENYNVSFPMFQKVDVNGDDAAPLYQKLKQFAGDPGDVKWNFEKFLVNRDGEVVARFRTRTKPDDPQVLKALEAELAKK